MLASGGSPPNSHRLAAVLRHRTPPPDAALRSIDAGLFDAGEPESTKHVLGAPRNRRLMSAVHLRELKEPQSLASTVIDEKRKPEVMSGFMKP